MSPRPSEFVLPLIVLAGLVGALSLVLWLVFKV